MINQSIIDIQKSGDQLPEEESRDVGLQQEGKPCICNSKFYKQCPPARLCMENRRDLLMTTVKPYILTAAGDHDVLDPDHVDPPVSFNLSPDGSTSYINPSVLKLGNGFRGLKSSSSSPSSSSLSSMANYDGKRRVKHRKVYVARRQGEMMIDQRPPIHTIKVRIPINLKDLEMFDIPEPPPLYQLRKYTSYESVPETQMVPVTKTIIKPVGLTKDQLIGDRSELFPKK